jgi:hypothetical protein
MKFPMLFLPPYVLFTSLIFLITHTATMGFAALQNFARLMKTELHTR